MRGWQGMLAGRPVRIVLSALVVLAFWLCAFCFGLSATQGVTAEELGNVAVWDSEGAATHATMERMERTAARESQAAEAMLVTGAGAALILLVRRKLYRPARSSLRRTVLLVVVIVCGMAAMLWLGLWLPVRVTG